MLVTLEDDTITLSMSQVGGSEERIAARTLSKLNRGGNIGYSLATIVSAIARSQIKTLIVHLVFTQSFQTSDETSKISELTKLFQYFFNSDYYFRIITGVGITSKNGIFSWTISQSKLLSDGRVQQINESHIEDGNSVDEDDLVIHDEFHDISNGIDYHTLTWRSRAVNLVNFNDFIQNSIHLKLNSLNCRRQLQHQLDPF